MNDPIKDKNIPHAKNVSGYISANKNILKNVENISLMILIYTFILCVSAIANGEFFIVQL